MKILSRLILLSTAAILMVSCGAKKLSVEDYNRLPAEERIAYLEQRVAKKPGDAVIKKQLYEEYLAVGDEQRALNVMEQYLQIDPYQPDVQFTYGELQYRNGDYRAAYQAFLTVMQGSSADYYLGRIAGYAGGSYITQQLTNSTADEAFPSFSLDGKKIIYQKRVGDSWDIYEMSLESKVETKIIATMADEELPVYMPSGTGIVFASTSADRRPIKSSYKVREIARMDYSDGYVTSLTRSFADDWLPRYNLDGSKIVFVSDREDLRKVSYIAKQSDIFIMDSDGDFQLPLSNSPSNEGGATFSADGKQVYFHSDRNGNYDLFVMRSDGSQVLTVVDLPGNDVNPSASPDGSSIAFVSDRSGNYEIYRAQSNGSAQEQLTFSPSADSNPVFSPDSKLIAYHSNRNNNFDIFIINLNAGTGEVTVASITERLRALAQ